MARWFLRNAHYLNILDPDTGEPTKWEYSETDRASGRARRKAFDVPQLLDPKDPSLWNYGEDIVVCHEGKGEPKDIIFFGPPTPDMEPMDEEAEEISNALKAKWAHPIETLPANGGMNEAEALFMKNMMEAFAKQVGATVTPPTVPNTSISQEQYDDLKRQLEEMRAMLATQQPSSQLPPAPIERRI